MFGVRKWSLAVVAMACAGLLGSLTSPVWAAAAPNDAAGEPQLGSFALGDGLEAAIGELDGSFGFGLPAGGVQLAWDSRSAAVDGLGLGGGWSFGLATVRLKGGVWVLPASGGAYQMSSSVASGLAGYPGTDVRFEAAAPGAVVPGRTDGAVEARAYAYALHELGGVSTYFDAAGLPVARLVLGGARVDWRWETRGGRGRLQSVVSADGSVTALDWSDPSRVTIQPGADATAAAPGSGAGGRWVVELDGGRVSAVIDPLGWRTEIGYDREGLVDRVSAPSGATTFVTWAGSTDGVPRVERVRVVDALTGEEASAREWGMQGEVSPLGWPLRAGVSPGELLAGGQHGTGYAAWISDGKTRTESEVDADGRVTERALVVTSDAGERVVQSQRFEYPESAGSGGVPGEGRHATTASTTHHDARGGTRTTSESYAFDALGRMVVTDVTPVAGAAEAGGPADGVTAEREYDAFGASVAKTLRSDTATSAGERRQLDELGRVVSQTDQRGVTEVTTYTPDGLVAEVRAGSGRVTTFDYDPASRALVGTRTSSPERATVTSSLRYDAAGRVIARTDANGVTVRTGYWADGSRREHTTETGSSTYYWDGDRLINEIHRASADRAGTASYLIGTTRHARSVRTDGDPATISYYGIDRHGSITDLTDQTGTVTTRYAYTDYGLASIDGDGSTPLPAGIGELGYNPFQYSGEYTYRDGMQALGLRTYDPLHARFLERDDAPLKNRYAYVDLNPITKVDPTGRWGEGDRTNAFLATFGMFVAIAGAALMLTTPGVLFTPMGWIGVGIAIGDAVLTTLQVIEGAKDIEFTDQEALATATRVFFAASLIAGVAGVAGALATRGPAKLTKGCMELMDAVCLRGNADETVTLLQAQAKAQTKAHVKASKDRMDDPDFLAENLHTINGWRVSLQSSKFEKLPSMVQGLSRNLTAEIKGVTGMLVDARAASVKALDDAYQYSTAEGMNISLLASEKSIRGMVEAAAKELAVLERRLNSELWEGVEGASTAAGQLKGVSEDLWRLLARKRGSALEDSESIEVVSDSLEDISLGF